MTEIGLLVNLELLDLSGNRFIGSLPTELGSLAQLEHISELGKLVTLRPVNLSSNMLTDPMPTEVLMIGNLRHLNIDENAITASLPDIVCSFTNVIADCAFIECNRCFCSSWSPSDLSSILPSEVMSGVPMRFQSRLPSESSSFVPSSVTSKFQRPLSTHSPLVLPSLSLIDIMMSQSATVSLEIDDCLNRELYNHERNEMEGILFDFVKQMLYDQNIQILNITIDSQSLVRVLKEQYHDQNNRRKLQLVSRRLDIRSYALCAESVDFQSSLEGSFNNADRNIDLLQTLKKYLPSSFPSMNQTSTTPVNDGTNAGTVGAATLAGVGAAAAASSASASSAGAAASASVGGGKSGGAGGVFGGERKLNSSDIDVREVSPDQHTSRKGGEEGSGRGEDKKSLDTGSGKFREKNNQNTNLGDDKLSKTGDALMIAEGGLEKKVGNSNTWKRMKRRLHDKYQLEIPANVVTATLVLKAVIRLKKRIKI